VKIYIDKDEWYPVLTPFDNEMYWEGRTVDVPEDFLDRYEKSLVTFDAMQKELMKLHDTQEENWKAFKKEHEE
jgi:hypothetical protein